MDLVTRGRRVCFGGFIGGRCEVVWIVHVGKQRGATIGRPRPRRKRADVTQRGRERLIRDEETPRWETRPGDEEFRFGDEEFRSSDEEIRSNSNHGEFILSILPSSSSRSVSRVFPGNEVFRFSDEVFYSSDVELRSGSNLGESFLCVHSPSRSRSGSHGRSKNNHGTRSPTKNGSKLSMAAVMEEHDTLDVEVVGVSHLDLDVHNTLARSFEVEDEQCRS
ncbi:hypothetical protein Droror1_Dr00024333 [Drosera rotundifolia]